MPILPRPNAKQRGFDDAPLFFTLAAVHSLVARPSQAISSFTSHLVRVTFF